MKNRRALALMGLLSAISIAQGRDDDSTSEAQSPSVVLVYSKDGANSMSGLCHDEGQNTLCDLTEVRIIPPNTKGAAEDERKLLQEFTQDPDKAKREFAKVATEMKQSAEKIRADPNLGPKRRRYFEKLLAAAEAQDFKRWAHVSVEQDRHTCHIWTNQFDLTFHRIGPRKWVTEAVPVGPCRIVEVWEMTAANKDATSLTIVVTTISIGKPGGPLCPSTIGEVEDRNPLSTDSDKTEYEPQPSCDFIAPMPWH